jgi:5-formyltetrahydrofolate cyclo-ligase
LETRFDDKAQARFHAWDQLVARGAARPPLPVHGRIPAFVGARAAARRLIEVPPWSTARVLKVNPDTAHYWVRRLALARGIVLVVAAPALTGAFRVLDPARASCTGDPVALECARAARDPDSVCWAERVALAELPPIDAIVVGTVAVSRSGWRAGKGAGYADLEYALLREFGHPALPVATTVHVTQLVDALPMAQHDVPLDLICTPHETIFTNSNAPRPERLDWSALDAATARRMTLLGAVRCA